MAMLNRLLIYVSSAALLAVCGPALAGDGQPSPWQMGFQKAATPIMEQITSFHDFVNIIIVLIALFVLGLLIYVMIRFNEKRHPQPSRTTHNTAARSRLDHHSGPDPGRHRHSLVPAALRPIRFPQGRPHHHRHGQPMVLDL